MNYILFDPPNVTRFYPFTLTRPLGEMRLFGGTVRDYWERYLGAKVSYLTHSHLSSLYPTKWDSSNNVLICSDSMPKDNGTILNIGAEIMSLKQIQKEWTLKSPGYKPDFNSNNDFLNNQMSFWKDTVSNVDISSNVLFNDEDGPIIIEENVTIMEGAMIRGPVHICSGSVIKMGAKIYGPTVIGPYCKVGGEVSDSIFLGYANKSHDGFLGHSIVGEWCNIGAGTSSSNLKNDYSTIKIWNYDKQQFIDSKQQYLGLYMGDHSKSAINTSFNTGTTIGVNCNIFGAGFPRNFIPSFSWGGSQGLKNYNIDKAIEVANKVMARRNVSFTQEYENLLRSIFDITANFRHKK
jgi:hypothetical protein